jgi:D-glycero-beta-D-manno-heptose-7-phosphate kinase
MKKDAILSLFEKFNTYNTLIVGDVMIDTYFWGKVDRISPEAPVPIITRSDIEHRLGGAANVARNIKALGANPILCSVIGNDDKADIFLDVMQQRGLNTEGIIKHDSRITTIKTRVISDNQHLLRIDEEIKNSISEEVEAELIKHIKKIVDSTRIDSIIFQDYDKGVITKNIIESVVEMAQAKDIPTLVDPKKRNFHNFKNVTLFKPNFKELVEGLKLEIKKSDIEGIHKASQRLQKEQNIKYVMTTLSELGVYISNNGSYHQLPAEIRDIADVSGAGDTVVSTASLCLAAGLPPKQIAWISNISGGLVCEKVGVVPIDKKLLLKECLELRKTIKDKSES